MLQMTLSQFRTTVEAGGILSVTLKGQGPGFAILGKTRRGEAVLIDQRKKQPRLFADLRKALGLLRELGIRKASVDAEAWQPEQADILRPSRPDRSAQLKAAHEAAEHDRWFRAQVEIGIKAAQDGRVRPFEDFRRQFEAVADAS